MGNIYNSLKNVFQNLIKENKNNSSFIPVLLVLITIPLSFAINNIALALFLLVVLLTFKKSNFKFQINLILPITLYFLMVVSYFWTIDKKNTLSGISTEIFLLLIPLAFLFSKDFSLTQKQKLISFFSYSMVILASFFSIRALVRYFMLDDIRVFFYHGENENDYGLVPKLLNAIHVSVFVAVAFFHFFTKEIRSKADYIFTIVLFGFLLLLSSKNMVLAVILLVLIYIFFFSKTAHKMRLRNLIVFGLLIAIIFSIGRIKQRFQVEFQTNTDKSLSANVIEGIPVGVHYVSIKEAWTNEMFTPNDYFNGTAFRVYQFRLFLEMMNEDKIFWKGYGLNASYPKIESKGVAYHVYQGDHSNNGYQKMNFHNQYVQVFAELGVFGFLILLLMLGLNLKNALISKDFLHFAFAFLMISLFLTESFLWRQRGVVFFTMLYCLFNSVPQLRDYSKPE